MEATSKNSEASPSQTEEGQKNYRPITPDEVLNTMKLGQCLEESIKEPGFGFADPNATNPETGLPLTNEERVRATRIQLASVVESMTGPGKPSTAEVADYLNRYVQKTTKPLGHVAPTDQPPTIVTEK